MSVIMEKSSGKLCRFLRAKGSYSTDNGLVDPSLCTGQDLP